MNMNLPPSVVSLMRSMNSYGRYNIMPAYEYKSKKILSYKPDLQTRMTPNETSRQEVAPQPVAGPTPYDVIKGRGQAVHRYPGNEKYRELVSRNKDLYARCPRSDKAKISKAIVAAVRGSGGRFLELDERSGDYFDIGDKKAVAKTSQALREGQTKIRKNMHGESGQSGHDTSLLTRGKPGPKPIEEYLGYSVQILESLYHQENTAPGPSLHPIEVASKPPTRIAQEPSVAAKAVRAHGQPFTDEEIIEYSLRVLEAQPLYETEDFVLPPLPALEMDVQCPSVVSQYSGDDADKDKSVAGNLELLGRICSV